jgi:ERCC4-related helicase
MLVPTVPLVAQQVNLLNEYLIDRYKIVGISGKDCVEQKAQLILASHVAVVTPQILMYSRT